MPGASGDDDATTFFLSVHDLGRPFPSLHPTQMEWDQRSGRDEDQPNTLVDWFPDNLMRPGAARGWDGGTCRREDQRDSMPKANCRAACFATECAQDSEGGSTRRRLRLRTWFAL